MKIEELKKKLILEAHNHFVAVQKTKPYVEFGNFVESLRRDDNTALIESIQQGVFAIIEGEFQTENDPGRSLLRKAEGVTAEQLNKFIEEGNTQQLMGLLYPFIIQSIDKANFANINTADKVFGKSIDLLPSKIPEMIPMKSGKPAAYLANFANKFITMRPIGMAKSPKENINIEKDEDVIQEEGNTGQYWEYRDSSKRKGAKEYGKALEMKNVEHEGEMIPMVKIRWKGMRDLNGKYTIKPSVELIPRDDLQAYNLRDKEAYNVDSLDTPVGEGTLEDRVASDTDKFNDSDTTTDILKTMSDIVDELNVDENMKKALNKYFTNASSDPEKLKTAKAAQQQLDKYLKNGTFPMLSGTKKVNPEYDSTEKLEKALDSVKAIISNNTPAKIKTIANEHGLGEKQLTTVLKKVKDVALDKQEIWDKRDQVMEPA